MTQNHGNPPPPKIKLCGQTRLEDIRFSFESGADYCGVVVNVPSSPRSMTVEQAEPLFREFGPKLFALTANAEENTYSEIAKKLKPAFFQLTGDETPEKVKSVISSFGIRVFKSIHLPVGGEPVAATRPEAFLKIMALFIEVGCEGFVLDVKSKGLYGGTGLRSDWTLAQEVIKGSKAKIFMAGGLSPENISQAMELGSYGLDLASGVEISPGVKSKDKIIALFSTLRKTT
jgi:phosphoribosylanthranilate isomerase